MDENERQVERQAVIIKELQHRLRNLFGVVEAVATRSLMAPAVPAFARDSFLRRLHDLAEAYNLSQSAQEGLLVDVLLQMLRLHETRIDISGCNVTLPPDVLQDIVLIVHELHTNSMKYGALSANAGRIRITGAIAAASDGQHFDFVWQESDGPPVSAPTTQGYGHFLLHRVPEYSGGLVNAAYPPGGLRYSCSWPLPRSVRKETTGSTSQ